MNREIDVFLELFKLFEFNQFYLVNAVGALIHFALIHRQILHLKINLVRCTTDAAYFLPAF